MDFEEELISQTKEIFIEMIMKVDNLDSIHKSWVTTSNENIIVF
jgi:hypothetical protein